MILMGVKVVIGTQWGDEGKGKIILYTRVAEYDNAFWYDLSNDRWQVIKITDNQWELLDDPPVLFKRLVHQEAQCFPEPDGSIEALYPFLKAVA